MLNRKIRWQPIVKIKGSLLFQWYWIKGSLEETPRALGLEFTYKNKKIVSGEISIELNETEKIESILRNKLRYNTDYLEKYTSRCYKFSNQLLETSKKLGSGSFTLASNEDLLSLYLDYQKRVLALIPFLDTILVLDGILKKEITQLFVSELGIAKGEDQDILLSKLVIPKKKNFFVKETESLLKMALELQRNKNNDIAGAIQKHLKQYAWMSSISYLGDFQTEGDVRQKVDDLVKEDPGKRLKEREKILKRTRKDFRLAYNKIEKSAKVLRLIDFAREFIYLQTYRLDVFFLAHYKTFPLLSEIARRVNIAVNDLVYLTGDEIQRILKGLEEVDKREIKRRKEDYALILENGKLQLYSGLNVEKTKEKVIKETAVQGTVASRGRATGKAKIIFYVNEVKKVRIGDIIVSPMTRPEFTPAIIKASGIITDFGGMLSHAAIISREFGKPCIVGTKIATKVFKDGDLVELNAYEGIARKLNKNES